MLACSGPAAAAAWRQGRSSFCRVDLSQPSALPLSSGHRSETQLRVWPTRAKVVSLSSILGLSSLEAGTLILTLSASTPLSQIHSPFSLIPTCPLLPRLLHRETDDRTTSRRLLSLFCLISKVSHIVPPFCPFRVSRPQVAILDTHGLAFIPIDCHRSQLLEIKSICIAYS